MKSFEKLKYPILLIILSLIFFNAYNIAKKKDGLFMDEVWSYTIANSTEIPSVDIIKAFANGTIEDIVRNYRKENSIIHQEDFIKGMFVPDGKRWNCVNTYLNKTVGDEHPPLYYFVLHTACFLTHSTNFYMIGFYINIVFLLLACVIIFKSILVIKKDKWLALLGLAGFGFSYGLTSTVTMSRMYSMCEFEVALLFYLYVKLSNRGWHLDKKIIISICLVEFLLMMTHYFALFIIIPLFLLSIYYLRNNRERISFLKANIATAAIYLILWPQSIIYVFLRIGLRATLGFDILNRIYYYSVNSINIFFANYIIAILFIVFFILCCIVKFQANRIDVRSVLKNYILSPTHAVIFTPTIFAIVFIIIISPWVHYRYISIFFPVIYIMFFEAFTTAVQCFVKKTKVYYITIFSFIVIVSVVFAPKLKIDWLHENNNIKSSFEANYLKYPAVIVTNKYDLRTLEVVYNCSHPYFIPIKQIGIKEFMENKREGQYVLYVPYDEPESLALANTSNEAMPVKHEIEYFNVYFVNSKNQINH